MSIFSPSLQAALRCIVNIAKLNNIFILYSDQKLAQFQLNMCQRAYGERKRAFSGIGLHQRKHVGPKIYPICRDFGDELGGGVPMQVSIPASMTAYAINALSVWGKSFRVGQILSSDDNMGGDRPLKAQKIQPDESSLRFFREDQKNISIIRNICETISSLDMI